jgi:hypothetical protein
MTSKELEYQFPDTNNVMKAKKNPEQWKITMHRVLEAIIGGS